MTKKKLLGIAAAGAAAAIAVYFIRRNKGQVVSEVKKVGGKLRRHVTDAFHNAKQSAQEHLAGA